MQCRFVKNQDGWYLGLRSYVALTQHTRITWGCGHPSFAINFFCLFWQMSADVLVKETCIVVVLSYLCCQSCSTSSISNILDCHWWNKINGNVLWLGSICGTVSYWWSILWCDPLQAIVRYCSFSPRKTRNLSSMLTRRVSLFSFFSKVILFLAFCQSGQTANCPAADPGDQKMWQGNLHIARFTESRACCRISGYSADVCLR